MPSGKQNGDGESLSQQRLAHMRESLQRILEPVRKEVEDIDRQLEVIEAQRQDLLQARREAAAVLRVADPEAHAKKTSPKRAARDGQGLAEESRSAMLEFLREHGDDFPEGFNVRALDDHPAMTLNKSTISRALPVLADEGLLRLDRIGHLRGKTGRESRIYKPTEGVTLSGTT